MKARKLFVVVSILFFICSVELFAQKQLNIEEKEVKKEKLKKLNKESFQNRSNEKADEAVKKQDIELGRKLASLLKSDIAKSHKYKGVIVKRFESLDEGKLGGDILDLTAEAKFGHINAITRVLNGYVQEMFGYQEEDAELLALYVIYYNYKHRNNISYINENFDKGYKTTVKKEKVGISQSFEGWQGKTEIIIPVEKNILKDGGIDIATYELEDQVNPDIDPQYKKKFAKLQTNKIKSEKEEVMEKYEKVLKREKELKDRKSKIDEELAELMKDPVKNKAAIEKLLAEKKKIDEELAKIDVEKKDLEAKIEQINRREEMRRLGITSEKEYLAYLAKNKKPVEQPVVIVEEKKPEPPPAKKEEVVITPPTKVSKSMIQTVHTGGKVYIIRESVAMSGGGIIALGYEAPAKDNPELVLYLLGSGELELVKTSEGIKLSPETPLIITDGKILVFEVFNGKTYLTQLNNRLEFEYRSSDAIDADSTVVVMSESFKVIKNKKTGADDEKSFKRKDLSLVK
jgi:hypothetical protein